MKALQAIIACILLLSLVGDATSMIPSWRVQSTTPEREIIYQTEISSPFPFLVSWSMETGQGNGSVRFTPEYSDDVFVLFVMKIRQGTAIIAPEMG